MKIIYEAEDGTQTDSKRDCARADFQHYLMNEVFGDHPIDTARKMAEAVLENLPAVLQCTHEMALNEGVNFAELGWCVVKHNKAIAPAEPDEDKEEEPSYKNPYEKKPKTGKKVYVRICHACKMPCEHCTCDDIDV